MKIEKLYETAKDTAERLSEISPKDRIYEDGGCIEGGSRNGAWFTGERYAHNIINDLKSGCTKWIDWNIVLDMQGGPNHVGNYCDAPILADEKTGQLHFQSSYYYIGHFSRFIKPDAERLGAELFSWMTPATVSGHLTDEAETLAFQNPDGTIVLIATNRTEADLVFEFKIEEAGHAQKANLSDWEKARTAANADTDSSTNPVYLKCPPRAIQTWILK